MVWFQTITITIASGIWLYCIGKLHNNLKKQLNYAIFLLGLPIIVSILVINEQFKISGPNYFGVEMLELILFFLVVSIEAICIARIIKKLIPKYSIFSFVPLYAIGLWLVSFFTVVIIGLVYPGS